MAVKLCKGQKVDLTKGNSGLNVLMVGLGWDEAQPEKKGFFASLFGGGTEEVDIDASVFVLKNGKLGGVKDVVYFGNLKHSSGAIVHQGDDLTGGGVGDNEQIMITLNKLPADCDRLVFVVNIYKAHSKNQHFGMVSNAYMRIVNNQSKEELLRYDLDENYDGMTAMIFGEVYRSGDEWKFSAIGEANRDPGLTELARRYER